MKEQIKYLIEEIVSELIENLYKGMGEEIKKKFLPYESTFREEWYKIIANKFSINKELKYDEIKKMFVNCSLDKGKSYLREAVLIEEQKWLKKYPKAKKKYDKKSHLFNNDYAKECGR